MTIRPRRSLEDRALKRPSALQSVPRDPAAIWLDKNENLDPELLELSQAVLREVPPEALATYPEAGEVYRRVARWVGVPPECLLLTPGSDGAIRLVFEAFVEHGDGVVHTSPTFAMYPVYSQMFGADVHAVEYEASPEGPRLDVDRMLALVRDRRPKLLCLPNPDSPTGTVVPPEAMRSLLNACEAAGTVFLVDEAYYPFHPWTSVEWTQSSGNLIVARTFAKAWGAAGLRVGYAVAHPETINLLHKMRPMYEVSTIAVEYVSRLMCRVSQMESAVDRLKAAKAVFVGDMRALGFASLSSAGNFVHVAFGDWGPAVHAALSEKVLYRANFEHPCLAGYSRFSIGTAETMARVTALIRDAIEERQ